MSDIGLVPKMDNISLRIRYLPHNGQIKKSRKVWAKCAISSKHFPNMFVFKKFEKSLPE